MIDLNFKYKKLLGTISDKAPFKPDIALILGSGLGGFADSVNTILSIPTSDLPGYPVSTVPGHKGFIHFAKYSGKKLLIFQGRIHFYEGYKLYECIVPVLITKSLGCKKLLLTNAAGGINSNFKASDLMLIKSINAITLKKELTDLLGLASADAKNAMAGFLSPLMNDIIQNAALEEKIILKEGVYYFSKGPSYETPAEIQMMARTGSDAVGMSTAHEAVYAVANGIETSAISLITNMAAGISPVKLSHKEVMEMAELAKDRFERLIKKTIELI
jgi:purine-nucleoside phosphorylase